MLKITNFDKLEGYADTEIRIFSVSEDFNKYRIVVILASSYDAVLIEIDRAKREISDPMFPNDKTPTYDMCIMQPIGDSGSVKQKDLGIKKNALVSKENIVQALKEILNDFINNK